MSKKDPTKGLMLGTAETADPSPVEAATEPRSEEETALAEARYAPDQIADYHDTHPTLDTSGPEHDPEVQQALREQYVVEKGLGVPEPVPVSTEE